MIITIKLNRTDLNKLPNQKYESNEIQINPINCQIIAFKNNNFLLIIFLKVNVNLIFKKKSYESSLNIVLINKLQFQFFQKLKINFCIINSSKNLLLFGKTS